MIPNFNTLYFDLEKRTQFIGYFSTRTLFRLQSAFVLEDHLMGELSLAEAEDVLHVSLQHGGIGVLGNHLQNLLVDGSLKNKI